MSTGIPLLDNIINGVNQAVNTVQNMAQNAVQITANPVNQAAIQLGNYIGQVSNGIGGIVTGVQNQLAPNTAQYQTVSYNPPNSSYVPYQVVPSVGQALQAPGTVYQQNTYPVTYGTGFNAPTNVNANISLQGFDFNTVYSAVNAAFGALPSIVNAIQNPLNNPYTSQLIQLTQSLYAQQADTVNQVKQLISNLQSNAYQSTSNLLRDVGIDVGGWSNLLDATVRTVMTDIGYSQTQAFKDISNMVKDGNAQQANAIFAVQNGINSFLQKLDITLNGQTDILKTLANARETTTTTPQVDIIQGAIDSAGIELTKVLAGSIDKAFNSPESFIKSLNERVDILSGVVENLKHGKYKSTETFFNDIFGNQPATGLARGIVILASIIPTLISAVNMAGSPALEAFGYLINQDSPVKLLGLGEYINAYFKDVISYGQLKDKAGKIGISEDELKTLLYQSYVEPGFNLMVDGKRRGLVSDKVWNDYLTDQRLNKDGQDIVNGLLHQIPGPSDLTRIADKRVWGLKTDAKYGQYAELPDEYVKQMTYWGYDRQYIEWLWASHWELPSPNQVFEMAHRGLIDKHDMDTFLGLTDWLPYFRDKLFDITYNVLTRVDVRRLFKEGLLTVDELHKQHRKMGYTEEDAYKLDAYVQNTNLPEDESENQALQKRVKTAIEGGYTSGKLSPDEAIQMLTYMGETPEHSRQIIAILEFENEIKDIKPVQVDLRSNVRTVVIAAYKKGNISKNDARTYLIAGGLTESDVDLQLSLIELERAVNLKSMAQDTAQKLFAQYSIDEKELYTRLGALGFGADEMNLIFQESLLMRDNRTKKLTVTQVQKLYKNGVIDINQYSDELKGLGYTDKDVIYLIENDLILEGQ